MINQLNLINYKSFLKQDIFFSPLTILTGLNASGKSSVINAIRIINYVCKNKSLENAEKFNLSFLRSKLTKDNFFELNMRVKNAVCSVKISDIPGRGLKGELFTPDIINKTKIAYISADRYGPRNTLPNVNLQELDNVGEFGEYSISYLERNEYEKVPESLRLNPGSENLKDSVNDWLGVIADGVNLSYKITPSANEYSLFFDGILPTETGYGLSFSLPVIISLLSMKTGVLLIENPEAHLHPAAQSALGNLIAKAAASGKQIIVETHSDHIIDGIRIASKNNEIEKEDISILFFDRPKTDEPTNIKTISVLENGKLSEWPNNFFDQNIKDKAVLIRH